MFLVTVTVLQVWCCVVKHGHHARRHNDLEGHSNFASTIYSFSILCLEYYTTVGSTVAFTYLKVKSAKSICSPPVVLVLFFGLDLKNLVFFTSLLLLHISFFKLYTKPDRATLQAQSAIQFRLDRE